MLDGSISYDVYANPYKYITLHLSNVSIKFICRECGKELGRGVISGELDEFDMSERLDKRIFDDSESFLTLNTVCERCRLEEEKLNQAFTNSVEDETYTDELFDGLMSAT